MASKENGGLGVGSLKGQNCALLLKWWWKLRDSNHYIWKEVIMAIHGLHDKPLSHMCKAQMSGIWKNICKVLKDFEGKGLDVNNFFSFSAGNGKKVRFWKDHWIGDASLQVSFPSLFTLERQKDCLIEDRIKQNCYVWKWAHGFNVQSYIDEFCALLHLLSSFSLSNSDDRLVCKVSQDGSFSVCEARRLIDAKLTECGPSFMHWSKWVPHKVNCFVWKACLGRIPVAKCLVDRGINIGSQCKICNVVDECSNHALILCLNASEVLKLIFKWCNIHFPNISSVIDLMDFGAKWGTCQRKRKILIVIIQCSLWFIWKARNEFVFNNIRKSQMAIFGDIVSSSFLWFKHRSNSPSNWDDWRKSPL